MLARRERSSIGSYSNTVAGTWPDIPSGWEHFTFANAGGIGRIYYSPGADEAGAGIDNLDLNPVPEPGTLFLMGTGLLGLGEAYRRRALKR